MELTVTQLVKKSSPFMEPEGSLPCSQEPFMEPEGSLSCSQEPATGPCREPHEFSPHPPTLFP
jgi:hypothetical protein